MRLHELLIHGLDPVDDGGGESGWGIVDLAGYFEDRVVAVLNIVLKLDCLILAHHLLQLIQLKVRFVFFETSLLPHFRLHLITKDQIIIIVDPPYINWSIWGANFHRPNSLSLSVSTSITLHFSNPITNLSFQIKRDHCLVNAFCFPESAQSPPVNSLSAKMLKLYCCSKIQTCLIITNQHQREENWNKLKQAQSNFRLIRKFNQTMKNCNSLQKRDLKSVLICHKTKLIKWGWSSSYQELRLIFKFEQLINKNQNQGI